MTAAEVITTCAAVCGVTPKDVRGPSREREAVDARRIAVAIMLDSGMNYRSVAKAIRRDRTSISHYRRSLNDLRQSRPSFDALYCACVSALEPHVSPRIDHHRHALAHAMREVLPR